MIDEVFQKNEIPWENCISLGVSLCDNTAVNVGKHKSLIVEARKQNANIILLGCPCHIAHNTAKHGTTAFEQVLKHFEVEELHVDVYFHFDYLSKRKNILVEFCELFVIKTTAKFLSSIAFAGWV